MLYNMVKTHSKVTTTSHAKWWPWRWLIINLRIDHHLTLHKCLGRRRGSDTGRSTPRSFTSPPTRWKSKFARGGGLRSSKIAPGGGERIDRRDGTIRRRRLRGWTFSDKVEGRTNGRERSTTQRDRWSERLFGVRTEGDVSGGGNISSS